MSCWTRLPIRQRLTITFAASMAAMIAGLGAFVYIRTGADLLDTVDAGLRSRAELLVTDLQHHDQAPVDVEPTLIESDEVFAQIADTSGRILQSSSIIARQRLLSAAAVRSVGVAGKAGYADRFETATTPFPERFYRWLTPVTLKPEEALGVQLAGLGIAAGDVRHVVLSHFHADLEHAANPGGTLHLLRNAARDAHSIRIIAPLSRGVRAP